MSRAVLETQGPMQSKAAQSDRLWVIETWHEEEKRWRFTLTKKGYAVMANAFRSKEEAETALASCHDHLSKWIYRIVKFDRGAL